MNTRYSDIYREPQFDPNTLANLGPLTGMAGTWVGEKGSDIHPTVSGPVERVFIEHYDLQPIDAQTNGPQLFYGLRYHTRLRRPEKKETFHDQTGYWLWEPNTHLILLTLSIPRGQVAMASGTAAPDARSFTVTAVEGSDFNGILSNPFLKEAFQTTGFEMTVTTGPNETWSYDQSTTLLVKGLSSPFLHTDRNQFKRIAAPKPNPSVVA